LIWHGPRRVAAERLAEATLAGLAGAGPRAASVVRRIGQHDPAEALDAAAAIKALSLAAGLERIHSRKCKALGLDKDSPLPDELPVLQFVDLTEGGHQSYEKWNHFTCLLRRTSPKVALFGPRAMSALSPECALKRTTANAADL
jgi:hypothetical protein